MNHSIATRSLIAVSVFSVCSVVCSAADSVAVFTAGENGYGSIRIPAIVAAKDGTLLAFAEGRTTLKSDQANNKIILKRSGDGGKSWGAMQIVADFGNDSLNNPCAVVERKSGRVILVFQQYPSAIREFGKMDDGCESERTVHSFVSTSDDGGAVWSKPRDIT